MTTINDLELRIGSAEDIIVVLKDELAELKTHLQELKEQQEKDKQPEQESLLGRWATHPKYGRGIITSDKPDTFKEVRFTIRNDEFTDGADQLFVRFDDLTLDPATLTTGQDFEDAPVGTIVEATKEPHDVYVKAGPLWYIAGGSFSTLSEGMPACRVIRWGNGK
ncbi:cell division protein ZapB [Corynebacterium sp. c8Ua_99]|uniref:cell division protein ZapB n=1 Tax=Corynebacterium sp. c8Ua_99 TaxID=3032335 RepID=UPI003267F7C3